MSQRPEPDDDQLFRFLLGEADGATASELEVWSQSTPARRARLGELRALISSLEQVPPADLVAGIDAKIASAQRRRVRRRSWGAACALAAAACATLIWATQRADLTEELVRKGSGLNTAERWAGVRAFRLEGQGTPAPLEGRLGAGDSLLFAYTNGGPSPFTHLLIFGVGSTGQVYWYYPAWTRGGEDPVAIAIRPSGGLVELHERISQPLPQGRLVLHAVFARQPFHVSDIERVLSDAGVTEHLPLPETAQQRYVVEVY